MSQTLRKSLQQCLRWHCVSPTSGELKVVKYLLNYNLTYVYVTVSYCGECAHHNMYTERFWRFWIVCLMIVKGGMAVALTSSLSNPRSQNNRPWSLKRRDQLLWLLGIPRSLGSDCDTSDRFHCLDCYQKHSYLSWWRSAQHTKRQNEINFMDFSLKSKSLHYLQKCIYSELVGNFQIKKWWKKNWGPVN